MVFKRQILFKLKLENIATAAPTDLPTRQPVEPVMKYHKETALKTNPNPPQQEISRTIRS